MRRGAVALLLAAALGGCGGVKTVDSIVVPPARLEPQPYVVPLDANFVVAVSEAVGSAEEDVSAQLKVFIDGQLAGQTQADAKSKEKKWGAAVPPGNHLFRFEYWTLSAPAEWTPLAAQWQPPERFIRIEVGQRSIVTLKFFDGGRRFASQIAREPEGSAR